MRKKLHLTLTALVCTALLGVTAAFAYWKVTATNSGNRVALANAEITLADADTTKEIFFELTDAAATEFVPQTYEQAKSLSAANAGVGESLFSVTNGGELATGYRLFLDESAYENKPAVKDVLQILVYRVDESGVGTVLGNYGGVPLSGLNLSLPFAAGNLAAGQSDRFHVFLWAARDNAFAAGNTFRFDVKAVTDREQNKALNFRKLTAGNAFYVLRYGRPLTVGAEEDLVIEFDLLDCLAEPGQFGSSGYYMFSVLKGIPNPLAYDYSAPYESIFLQMAKGQRDVDLVDGTALGTAGVTPEYVTHMTGLSAEQKLYLDGAGAAWTNARQNGFGLLKGRVSEPAHRYRYLYLADGSLEVYAAELTDGVPGTFVLQMETPPGRFTQNRAGYVGFAINNTAAATLGYLTIDNFSAGTRSAEGIRYQYHEDFQSESASGWMFQSGHWNLSFTTDPRQTA